MAGASKKYCKICWIEQGDAYILSARKAHNSSYRYAYINAHVLPDAWVWSLRVFLT